MPSPPIESIYLPGSAPDDGDLAVRYAPPGPGGMADVAILYAHGFGSRQGGEKTTYFRQRAIDAGLGFCSFDFQGHGESGGTMLGLTASRNLADMARAHSFLRDRGIRRVVLMGSSMGGGCALWYAARHPDDIVAAMHIAPALELEIGLSRWAGPEGMARWQREGRHTFSNDLVTCELSWALVEDLRAFDPTDLEARYRTPTLIFQGVHDASVDWQAVANFVARTRGTGVEMHLFGDGDHRLIPQLDRLWVLARGFLTSHGLLAETP